MYPRRIDLRRRQGPGKNTYALTTCNSDWQNRGDNTAEVAMQYYHGA